MIRNAQEIRELIFNELQNKGYSCGKYNNVFYLRSDIFYNSYRVSVFFQNIKFNSSTTSMDIVVRNEVSMCKPPIYKFDVQLRFAKFTEDFDKQVVKRLIDKGYLDNSKPFDVVTSEEAEVMFRKSLKEALSELDLSPLPQRVGYYETDIVYNTISFEGKEPIITYNLLVYMWEKGVKSLKCRWERSCRIKDLYSSLYSSLRLFYFEYRLLVEKTRDDVFNEYICNLGVDLTETQKVRFREVFDLGFTQGYSEGIYHVMRTMKI